MLSGEQENLISAALRDAERHDLALGGNAALTAHGLPGFSTKEIELVTTRDTPRGLEKAARAVEAGLRRDGYRPERAGTGAERRATAVPGPRTQAQWTVPTGGKHDHPPIGKITDYKCAKCFERSYLDMTSAPRSRKPTQTAIGPVLHPEDAAGSRVRDLAARGQVRDYADTARLLERWSPRQLTEFARRQDPGLDPRDLERAAARLGTLPDVALTGLGIVRPEQVSWLRLPFAIWNRDPRDASRRRAAGRQRERPEPAREARQRPDATKRPQRDEPQLRR